MKPVFRHLLQTAAIATTLMVAAVSQAHHSFAMYDLNIEKSFTGKLTRFIVGANHSQFIFDVVDEQGNAVKGADGKPLIWGVETGPASGIARQGITVESFPLGTFFSITLNPLRDGRNAGTQKGAIILCGMTLPAGGCTRETGKAYMERANFGGPAPNGPPPEPAN